LASFRIFWRFCLHHWNTTLAYEIKDNPMSTNPEGIFWDDQEVPLIVSQHRDLPSENLPAAPCTHASGEQYDDMTVAGLRVRG
jgi:hypothetical protein